LKLLGVTLVVDFRILRFLFVTLLGNNVLLDLAHDRATLGLRVEEHIDSDGLLAAHAGSFAEDGCLGLLPRGGLEAPLRILGVLHLKL